MAKTKRSLTGKSEAKLSEVASRLTASTDELMLASLEAGGDGLKTGRHLVTFKEGATDAGLKSLRARKGLRLASSADFTAHAVRFEEAGDADAMVFPQIGVALVSGNVAEQHKLTAEAFVAEDGPVHSVDPEYFMFTDGINPNDYLQGFRRADETIRRALRGAAAVAEELFQPEVVGATWGLIACKVPPSVPGGSGIKVAVLDTGFDLGHPEFAGRAFVTNSFVGQPVQDLHGHGTHTTGTACGPQSPAGAVPRYGIGFRTQIFVGKVLTNSGSGTQAQVLAGMNWAIANRCAVISMSLGAQMPVQPSYTAAGSAALAAGCLIIAAAGNASHRPAVVNPAGAPANSPTVMSVAALDSALKVAVFSNGGKVDIAGPGVNVFSSWPRPVLHKTISGTSMATPHVAGCAALWAQTSAALRGAALRARLLATAKHLPFPPTDVGAGLVQAP